MNIGNIPIFFVSKNHTFTCIYSKNYGIFICRKPMSSCGRRGQLYPAHHEPALLCPQHRHGSCRPVPPAALAWLQRAADCSGRDLPGLPPAPPAARALLGRFMTQALERAPRLRQRALAATGSMACAT